MDDSPRLYLPTAPGGHPQLIPVATAATGGVLLLVAAVQAITVAQTGAPTVVVGFDFVFFGAPGVTLVYTGFWMPTSDIDVSHYPRLVAWMLGGVAVMFGFVVLRDLHPAVSVEWATGTQAIALTIGSIGGLLVGIQERKNDRLEEFASVVSHDLRNPLNVAQGHLELARAETEHERLGTVADAHDRMGRLIDDLLTLAREGETISHTEPVDLDELATACGQNLATTEATLAVTVDRTVAADRDRLRQLLENGFGLRIVRQIADAHGWDVRVTDGDDGGARFEFSGVEFPE